VPCQRRYTKAKSWQKLLRMLQRVSQSPARVVILERRGRLAATIKTRKRRRTSRLLRAIKGLEGYWV
jgi:hypothetical protein